MATVSPRVDFAVFIVRPDLFLMPRISAGLLMYRPGKEQRDLIEVLLVHPGGPYWKNEDEGAWTIPKGEVEPEEEFLTAALREFSEETGLTPAGPFIALGAVKQESSKTVHAWAFRGTSDPTQIQSNTFEIEWPPNSGGGRNSRKWIEPISSISPTPEERYWSPNSRFSSALTTFRGQSRPCR